MEKNNKIEFWYYETAVEGVKYHCFASNYLISGGYKDKATLFRDKMIKKVYRKMVRGNKRTYNKIKPVCVSNSNTWRFKHLNDGYMDVCADCMVEDLDYISKHASVSGRGSEITVTLPLQVVYLDQYEFSALESFVRSDRTINKKL